MENLVRLSKSQIQIQNDCLGKFYFQYIKKADVKKHTWSTTIFGEIIHAQIENFLNKYKDDVSFKEVVNKVLSKKKLSFSKTFLYDHDLGFKNQFETIEKEYIEKNTVIKFTRKFPEKEFFNYGDKWSPLVIKFLVKYLRIDLPFENEKKFEVEVSRKLLGKDFKDKRKIQLVGVYDHLRENDIVDFKTTTISEKYYYIDWLNDLQSLMYYFAFYLENKRYPEAFTYIVFNLLDSMFFITQHSYDNSEQSIEKMRSIFSRILEKFLINYDMAEDKKYWKPEPTKCGFCVYKDICSKSIAKKK